MEVRPGYKQTAVGVIPKDWQIESLGTICDVRDGTHDSPRFFDSGVPFVTSKNIVDGRLDLEDVSFISKADAIEFDKRSKVDRNDILMSMIGTIGSAVLIDFEPSFCIKNLALLKPRNISPRFLIQLINSPAFQYYLDGNLDGGIQKFVSLGTLRQLAVQFPPEPEQRAIATALSDVDALLGALDRLIAKKRDLKQAAMQQLLTGQTRLPGFHGQWEVKRLGDLGTFFSGGTPNTSVADYYGGDVPWITSSDCNAGRIKAVSGRITPAGVNNSATKWIKSRTLLMALYGATAGVVAISEIDATINQAVLAIVLGGHDSEFMFQKLSMMKDWIIATYTQGGQPNLSGAIVKSIEMALPDPPEQTAIAEVLSDMDAEIAALEQRREKTAALKQGMMQELLTGRVRLTNGEGRIENGE